MVLFLSTFYSRMKISKQVHQKDVFLTNLIVIIYNMFSFCNELLLLITFHINCYLETLQFEMVFDVMKPCNHSAHQYCHIVTLTSELINEIITWMGNSNCKLTRSCTDERGNIFFYLTIIHRICLPAIKSCAIKFDTYFGSLKIIYNVIIILSHYLFMLPSNHLPTNRLNPYSLQHCMILFHNAKMLFIATKLGRCLL